MDTEKQGIKIKGLSVIDIVLIIALIAAAAWFQNERQNLIDNCRKEWLNVLQENCDKIDTICTQYDQYNRTIADLNKDKTTGEVFDWIPNNTKEN